MREGEKIKASPVIKAAPLPSPCRGGLGRGRREVWREVRSSNLTISNINILASGQSSRRK
jgi:hypothetical protein